MIEFRIYNRIINYVNKLAKKFSFIQLKKKNEQLFEIYPTNEKVLKEK